MLNFNFCRIGTDGISEKIDIIANYYFGHNLFVTFIQNTGSKENMDGIKVGNNNVSYFINYVKNKNKYIHNRVVMSLR